MTFIISCWVVGSTSILSITCSVYTTEHQKRCFLPCTFHYSISDPLYIWVWFAGCCTTDIHWGSLIVTWLYWGDTYPWCLCKRIIWMINDRREVFYVNRKVSRNIQIKTLLWSRNSETGQIRGHCAVFLMHRLKLYNIWYKLELERRTVTTKTRWKC